MNILRSFWFLAWIAPCVLAAPRAAGQLTPAPIGGGTATYYVSTTGSDSNPGTTTSKPFRTIQKAVNSASKAGDTIYVAPGTYGETVTVGSSAKSGSKTKPMRLIGDVKGTVTGSTAGEVIIDGQGTRQYGIRLDGPDYWSFSNLRVRSQTYANVWTGAGSVTNITFDSCTFDVTPSWGVYMSDCGNVALTGNTFNRTGKSGHSTYLYQTSGDTMTITGNRLTLTGGDYLSSGFRKGELWYAGGSFTYSSYCYGIIAMAYNTSSSMQITVQNNVVSDSYLGLYVYNYGNKKASALVCSNNTVVGCYYGMYIYSDAKTAATITNNITGDCYVASYVYAPKGTLDGHLAYGIGYNACKAETWKGCGYITVATLGTVILGQAAEFADPALGDFSLTGSVGIDAGVTLGAPAIDVAGTERPIDGDGDGTEVVDIGAFESQTQQAQSLRIIRWEEVGVDEE